MLKRLPQDRLEEESTGAVAGFFNSSGWEFKRTQRDNSGIDGEIEIILGVERTGRFLKAQIKAGTSYISSEDENNLRIRVERKYLEHWAKMTAPVLLFFYHPVTRILCWKAIKEYLALYPSLLKSTSETCIVSFDKEQDILRFESLPSITAVERQTFLYDRIQLESSSSELGWSNWFLVKAFPTLWKATATSDIRSQIVPHLTKEYAFVVQEGDLYTFSNLQDPASELRSMLKMDSIRSISLDDFSPKSIVELLNQSLVLFAKSKDLLSHGNRFYFSPAVLGKLETNRWSYVPLKGGEETQRTKIYIQRIGSKTEYKHHAVRLSMLQHSGQWYLQIDPDWYFTYPFGKRPPRSAIGARITSEKADTHNKDYLYLLHAWRQFLSGGADTICIPCTRPSDGSSVRVSSSPLEFTFHFRLFNDYTGAHVNHA